MKYSVELDCTGEDFMEFLRSIALMGIWMQVLRDNGNAWECKFIAAERRSLVSMIQVHFDNDPELIDLIEEVK